MELYAVCSYGSAFVTGLYSVIYCRWSYTPCVVTGVLCHRIIVCNWLQMELYAMCSHRHSDTVNYTPCVVMGILLFDTDAVIRRV